VKWHLPASTAAEHRGRTEKSNIKDHKVSWDYMRTIPIRLTIDKSNNLQESLIHFEVVQDYSSGARGEKITLGFINLNLAEYIEESENVDVEEGVVRRYLMQESKINSTLKIGIAMKQVDGERNFTAPPLKSAPVFGGIAGIIAGEQAEQDELSSEHP
jgi:N-terminal C2 in EEIG1 and EHBP1 proteins